MVTRALCWTRSSRRFSASRSRSPASLEKRRLSELPVRLGRKQSDGRHLLAVDQEGYAKEFVDADFAVAFPCLLFLGRQGFGPHGRLFLLVRSVKVSHARASTNAASRLGLVRLADHQRPHFTVVKQSP